MYTQCDTYMCLQWIRWTPLDYYCALSPQRETEMTFAQYAWTELSHVHINFFVFFVSGCSSVNAQPHYPQPTASGSKSFPFLHEFRPPGSC